MNIHDVFLNTNSEKCISLAAEKSKDPVLMALKNQIIKGWPSQRSECLKTLIDYWSYCDELSILDSLILKGTHIVIPNQCRDELLVQLHEGHFGIDHTKLRVHDSVYWPGINKDIEKLVKTCDTCQKNSRRNDKDPVIPREIPATLWSTIEMDLFILDDNSFLLVVDVTSCFPVVRILSRETSNSVINALEGVYCDFGLPKKILSDNRPCFKVEEFIDFHVKLGIQVKKSSSYNHQSVGSVERMVQTVK